MNRQIIIGGVLLAVGSIELLALPILGSIFLCEDQCWTHDIIQTFLLLSGWVFVVYGSRFISLRALAWTFLLLSFHLYSLIIFELPGLPWGEEWAGYVLGPLALLWWVVLLGLISLFFSLGLIFSILSFRERREKQKLIIPQEVTSEVIPQVSPKVTTIKLPSRTHVIIEAFALSLLLSLIPTGLSAIVGIGEIITFRSLNFIPFHLKSLMDSIWAVLPALVCGFWIGYRSQKPTFKDAVIAYIPFLIFNMWHLYSVLSLRIVLIAGEAKGISIPELLIPILGIIFIGLIPLGLIWGKKYNKTLRNLGQPK